MRDGTIAHAFISNYKHASSGNAEITIGFPLQIGNELSICDQASCPSWSERASEGAVGSSLISEFRAVPKPHRRHSVQETRAFAFYGDAQARANSTSQHPLCTALEPEPEAILAYLGSPSLVRQAVCLGMTHGERRHARARCQPGCLAQ